MAQFKVVITDFGSPENDLEANELKNSGLDIELVRLNAKTPQELLPHVADADGLIVQWTNINHDVIRALQKCKVISRYGIGVDMIDLAAAGEHGIPVCNTPDYCIEEVSTHTITFLLMLNRNIKAQDQHVRDTKWGSPNPVPPSRLSTQTLGIIGMGNIGRVVVQKAKAFGLNVLVFDPYLSAEKAVQGGAEKVELDELLRRSDYVSIHCPLTAETRHLISTPQLKAMKPTAYLINMARGPIVDQAALHQALVSKTIAGAALDVFEVEPPPADEPILKLDNVIFTPHLSSWSAESFVQLRQEVVRNVVEALQGQSPRSIVNRKFLVPNGQKA
ncbi:MAG: C-terminal binding protein [Chloroflexi bacterium]|nr:C-terminal binding protein [Chloroflexota bacterium]MCC6893860.1 C-terminal binding protein [Anaerolineae bacterium]